MTNEKGRHKLPVEDVRQWLTHKDSGTLRNTQDREYRANHLRLTRALRAAQRDAEPREPPQEEQAQEEQEVEDPAAPIQARPKRRARAEPADAAGYAGEGMNQLVQELAGLRQEVRAAAQPRQLEVDLPDLEVDPDVLGYVHPTEVKRRYECAYPEGEVTNVDISGFDKYLSFNLGHLESSRNKFNLGVERLCNTIKAVTAPDEVIDCKAYLVALYKQNVLVELMHLPAFDLKYGWARDLVASLVHFVEYGIHEAKRLDQPRVVWHLEQLNAEVLEPWSRRAQTAKKAAENKRQEVAGFHNTAMAHTLRNTHTHTRTKERASTVPSTERYQKKTHLIHFDPHTIRAINSSAPASISFCNQYNAVIISEVDGLRLEKLPTATECKKAVHEATHKLVSKLTNST